MTEHPAYAGGATRSTGKGLGSIACLAFVAILAAAFWAGALWIGEILIRIVTAG